MKISPKPILLPRLGYVIVGLLLAVLFMLVYQLSTAISDPTQKVLILDDSLSPISIMTTYHLDPSGWSYSEYLETLLPNRNLATI
jgi:hypothetical protein